MLRHSLAGLLLLAVAGLIIVIGVWPVFAAVELVDYQVRSTQNDILLLWNTAHEYDLSGFEVMCKKAAEPDTAYHSIGFREAQGGPQSGGTYFFLLNRGLEPAQTYCFRLQEKTTNGQPGEVFDRCGYGLGITPTPTLTLTALFTNTTDLTNSTGLTTSTVLTNTPIFTSILIISGTPGIAVPQVAANAVITNTGSFTTVATVTPVVVSPLQTPLPPAVNPALTLTPLITTTASTSLGAPITSSVTATATLVSPAGPPLGAPISPLATITSTSPLTQANGLPPSDGAQVNNGLANGVMSASATDTAVQVPDAPDPVYLIFTQTPAPTAIALAPILTPLPSVTPSPGLNLTTIAQSGMQNIVILLLCFTFLGASGLGVVGLLTSVLYMRSRNQARDLNGQPVLLNKPPKRRINL